MLLLLLLPLALSVAAQDSPFVEPRLRGNGVEVYDNEEQSYALYLKQVSFEEARVLCMSEPGGGLLEFTDSRVAEFMGRALAESAVGFTSVWIGGQYQPSVASFRNLANAPRIEGVWKWLSGDVIDSHPVPGKTHFPMEVPPFWLDRPDLTVPEVQCLAVDRNKHHRPIILALPCGVKRPFVCSMPPTSSKTAPTLVPPAVKVNEKRFYLFEASYTWVEALSFCRTMNYRLAVVTKPTEFVKLQLRMLRARPIFENAWIGGKFMNGKWTWIANNEVIPTEASASTTNGSASNATAAPWYRPGHVTMGGCLLADRHVCDYFVFVEERCDRKRGFICEDEVEEQTDLLLKVPGPMASTWVSSVRRTWQDAQDLCLTCLDGNLLELDFQNKTVLKMQLQSVYSAMAVVSKPEIRHLWMNAHLFGGDHFTGRKSAIKELVGEKMDQTVQQRLWANSSGELLGSDGEDGQVFYCPGDFQQNARLTTSQCLNMDRENQKHYLMYELSCSYQQHFMCVASHGKAMHTLNYTCTWDYFGKSKNKKK